MKRRGDGGFVLVIVLAVLAVLALLAAAAAVSGQRAVADAAAEQERFQSQLDQASTRETLLFMLATHGRNLGGLRVERLPVDHQVDDDEGTASLPLGNEIRLDSRPYQGIGRAVFALQDDRGLLSVNWAPDLLRRQFVLGLGGEADIWSPLEDERRDYQDTDSLRRLAGAEATEYREQGLDPPANRTLTSPLELRRLPTWGRLLAGVDDATLLSTLTMTRTVSLNLNTAPAAVLGLIPGMTPAEAERLIAMRRSSPLLSLHAVKSTFPLLPGSEEYLSLFANNSGNLILADRVSGARRLLHWTLTPMGDTARPWRIDYEVTLPRGNQPDQPVAGAPATPLFPAPDPHRQ